MKEQVISYLATSGIPKTRFCRRLNISTNHLYAWLNGERNISEKLRIKIKNYLDKYYVK